MRGSKVGKCFICGRSVKKADLWNGAFIEKTIGDRTVLICKEHPISCIPVKVSAMILPPCSENILRAIKDLGGLK